MGAETAVRVERLGVVRGGNVVLSDLALSVPVGRVTGLLGPSGSGKTTLMRAIVGVQRVDAGAVEVLGRPAGSAELRHEVGYMTQAPSVYGDLTVEENLRYFASIHGVGRDAVRPAIDAVDLGGHSARLVRTLSGGEQSRVSLAVTLVGRPRLLVLDEPTVGLDPVLRRDLWELFGRLAGEGTTLLVSSHVMDEADRCDDLLLLREGRIVAAATPEDVRRRTGESNLEQAFLRLVEDT